MLEAQGFSGWLVGGLDFVLVWVLIYQALLLIRGTRAVQVLVGILAVALAYLVSRDDLLGLPAVHWLLDKFIGAFIVLVVVLFQDDIRRGLSKVGRGRWLGGFQAESEGSRIEELVKAAQLLTRAGLGGLVVIERNADLTPIADEGTRVDALLSKELLFAIFNPSHASPLHDGAVVVRGERIVAAACFLPLTTSGHVERTLGTRHRAGIGVTEDIDAIAVIVSESSRTVSVAAGGQLSRPLDANELRATLQRLLGRPEARATGSGAVPGVASGAGTGSSGVLPALPEAIRRPPPSGGYPTPES